MLEFEEHEGILTSDEIDRVYATLSSEAFPWFYFNSKTVGDSWYNEEKDENTREHLQLFHLFNTLEGVPNSNYTKLTDFILNRFLIATGKSLKKRFKTKANFQPRVDSFLSNQYNTPHTDARYSHYVVLYYPHTTDGDTFIFDKTENGYKCIQRITPKAGKYIIFNGAYYHAGSHPKQNDYRIVINYNLTLNE